MNEHYLMGAAANEETILYGIPTHLFKDIILNYPKVSQFLIASFATNTRDPFSENTKENYLQMYLRYKKLKIASLKRNQLNTVKIRLLVLLTPLLKKLLL